MNHIMKKAVSHGLALVLIIGVVAVVGMFMMSNSSNNSPTGFATAKWYDCNDPDAQTQFDKNSLLTKSVTTFSGGSKTDKCYTWNQGKPNERTRLIEGTCKQTSQGIKFNYWYADCSSLGNSYKCEEGVCVQKSSNVDVDLVVTNLLVTGSDSFNPLHNNLELNIFNKGKDDIINTFQIGFWICNPTSNNCIMLGNSGNKGKAEVSGLLSGETKKIIFMSYLKNQNYLVDGTTMIKIVIDVDQEIQESDETNNIFQQIVDICQKENCLCADSDGLDIHKKTWSGGLNPEGEGTIGKVDICSPEEGKDVIYEGYCNDKGQLISKLMKCPLGEICNDGACKHS